MEKAIWAELERLKREPVPARELEKARNRLLADQARELDSNPGIASSLSFYEAVAGNWRYVIDHPKVIATITARGDLGGREALLHPRERRRRRARAAGALGRRCAMNRVLWLSLLALGCASAPKAPPAPEQVIAGRVTTDPEAKSKPKGAYGYFPLPKALSADPTKLEIPTLDFEVLAPERVVLDNGLQIYLLADRTVPMLTVSALVWGGGFDEPADKLGVSDFAFGLLASAGAGKRTAEELDELLEFHAANAGGGSGGETSSFGIDLRSGDVDTLFPVFADMLLRPRFQKDRFEIAIARAIEGVRRRPDSPDGLAGRALVKAIYGKDSVFAREPTEQTLRAIRISDLEAFRKKILSPKSTVLLVSGDFDREKLLGLVKTHLGGWRGGERIVRSYPPSAPLSRRVVFVPKEVAQTKIRIGGYGFQRRSPEEFALRVLNTALGGGLGAGRLYREIREAKGLAYSAYSVVAPGPTRGLFYAGADTRPEQTADAIAAMLSTLDGRDRTAAAPARGALGRRGHVPERVRVPLRLRGEDRPGEGGVRSLRLPAGLPRDVPGQRREGRSRRPRPRRRGR